MDSTAQKANLKQYRAVGGKWKFVPVVKVNGKPDPRLVLIDGEPTSFKGGGKFYIEYRDGAKRIQKPCGVTPREALDAWHLQTGILSGKVEKPAETADDTKGTSKTIDHAIAEYLTSIKATKSDATARKYYKNLSWFRQHCTKHLVARLDRSDIMSLFTAGRAEGLNQKTINGRVMTMLGAMRQGGATTLKLNKGEWPKTADVEIEIYEPEELHKFFDACTPKERLTFQTFLLSGFRDKEIGTLTWPDILKTPHIRVEAKEGFTPKSYETRKVRIPASLHKVLKAEEKASTSKLVFPPDAHPTRPNYGGKDTPNAHLLILCKEIAFRAGLNCGKCKGTYTVKRSTTRKEVLPYSCKTHPRCSRWYLHKFRSTFATNQLQSGVDIKTLMTMLGHKNLATTEKYLKMLDSEGLESKIENSKLTAFL
jgi:integrase/recombinase XerD